MRFWSSWTRDREARKVVALLVGLTVVDTVLTWTLISLYGVVGEANPFIRTLFAAGLGPLWLPMNLILTVIGTMALASIYVLSSEKAKLTVTLGLALLASLKWLAALSHVSFIYHNATFWVATVISTSAIFLIMFRLLTKRLIFDFGLWHRTVFGFLDDLSTSVVTFKIPQLRQLIEHSRKSTQSGSSRTPSGDRRAHSKRLLFWLGIIVLGPLIVFGLIELIIATTGVYQIPLWLRRLGIVEEAQGRAMLLIFVAITVMVGVLVYAISSVLDILAGVDKR